MDATDRDDEPIWRQVPDILRGFAEVDLRSSGEVAPCLAAYNDDALLFFAFVRSFEKGEYHVPVGEVLMLAHLMGAKRLALTMAGRVWSLDDPVPPMVEGVGDLRQRAVIMHQVDAAGTASDDAPTATSQIWPFDIDGRQVRWGHVFAPPDRAEGWVPDAIEHTAAVGAGARHDRLRAGCGEALDDLQSLGHTVVLGITALTALERQRRAENLPTAS